jgi:hypothetical protein
VKTEQNRSQEAYKRWVRIPDAGVDGLDTPARRPRIPCDRDWSLSGLPRQRCLELKTIPLAPGNRTCAGLRGGQEKILRSQRPARHFWRNRLFRATETDRSHVSAPKVDATAVAAAASETNIRLTERRPTQPSRCLFERRFLIMSRSAQVPVGSPIVPPALRRLRARRERDGRSKVRSMRKGPPDRAP